MKLRSVAAVFCAAVMAFTGTVFANPSISDKGVTLDPSKNMEGLTLSEIDLDGAAGMFTESDELTAEQIAKIVEGIGKVNSADADNFVDVEEFVTVYLGIEADADNPILTVNTRRPVDLEKLAFVAAFLELAIDKDGAVEVLDEEGNVIETDVTMAFDELKDEDDLEGYLIMVINTKTGEPLFVDLHAEDIEETFDKETGEVTIPFPCLGPFALVQEMD